ncbi:MAG: site-specific integrase, partial [Bacteroidota bacterium]
MKKIHSNLYREMNEYLRYVSFERGLSNNTRASYTHDLTIYAQYLQEQGIESFTDSTSNNITGFLEMLGELGLSISSRSRYLSSLRGFHRFLFASGYTEADVTEKIDLPRIKRHLPETLTIEQVQKILVQPDTSVITGIRDRTMLETLYACGLRVSELIVLKQ